MNIEKAVDGLNALIVYFESKINILERDQKLYLNDNERAMAGLMVGHAKKELAFIRDIRGLLR